LLPRPFSQRDPRRKFALEEREPRVHFALSCGARSCPPIRIYSAETIDDQLEAAARSVISAETTIDIHANTLTTLSVFRRYRRDFGQSEADVLRYILLYLDDETTRTYLRQNLLSIKVVYRPIDWTLHQA
jgi:hypothetical protein